MATIVDQFDGEPFIRNTDPRVVSEEQGIAGFSPGMGPMDPNDLFFQLPLNSLRGLDLLRFKDLGGRDDEDDPRDYLTAQLLSESSPSTEDTGIRKLLQYLPFGDKSLLRRGFEGISNLIPRSDPRTRSMQNFYGSRFGLTPTGSVASGIMAGYNPVSGFGRNKNFGLARAMQKRIERIQETLKKKDSAQLENRLENLRNLQKQEIQDRSDKGESLSSIGKSTFSGKGMAFEKGAGKVR